MIAAVAWIAIFQGALMGIAYLGACTQSDGSINLGRPDWLVISIAVVLQLLALYVGTWRQWWARLTQVTLLATLFAVDASGLLLAEKARVVTASRSVERHDATAATIADIEKSITELTRSGARPRAVVEAAVLEARRSIDPAIDRRTEGCTKADTVKPDLAHRVCQPVREAASGMPIAAELERLGRELRVARGELAKPAEIAPLARLPGISLLGLLACEIGLIFATLHLAAARAQLTPPLVPAEVASVLAGGQDAWASRLLHTIDKRGGKWTIGPGGQREIATELQMPSREVADLVAKLELRGVIRVTRARRDRIANSEIARA